VWQCWLDLCRTDESDSLPSRAELFAHSSNGGRIENFRRAGEDGLLFELDMLLIQSAELAGGDQEPFVIFLVQLA